MLSRRLFKHTLHDHNWIKAWISSIKVNDESMTSRNWYQWCVKVWFYRNLFWNKFFVYSCCAFHEMSVIHSVANLSDHEEILSLTSKDKDFYGGMDYLPHALYNWLVEGSDPGSRRKNLIFLLDQKIIGFMSIYFQKKWTSCVKFAFRISR